MTHRDRPWNTGLAGILAEASPDALIALDPNDFNVLFWNQGAETIFGYSSDEAVGRSIFDLVIPPDRVAETRQLLADTVTTGAASAESIRRTKDGSLVHVEVSCSGSEWTAPSFRSRSASAPSRSKKACSP